MDDAGDPWSGGAAADQRDRDGAEDRAVVRSVENLRHDVERVVKSPGAQLKSAPFHSASSLKSLAAGSQVVILVSTRYWYGVETESGEHGWVHHSQLEPLP